MLGADHTALRAGAWLAAFILSGVVLSRWYPHSAFEDAGTHFLFARSAWSNPLLFVSVWGRPLFTVLFAIPALAGYPTAKLLTVAICAATGWQTYRLAREQGMERSDLAIPLLYLQPTYFLLSADTMTEPLFALVFVIALRLHLLGRRTSGMLVASLLILVRPEGFFLGLVWGLWILFDRRDARAWWRRVPSLAWLATGGVAWWLGALLVTGDPLFIRHNWPGEWTTPHVALTWQPLLDSLQLYWQQRVEITGLLLFVPFVVGVCLLALRRRMGTVITAILTIFVLHGVFRAYGIFQSTGEPRYFITVAPAIAIVMLAGWNAIARPIVRWSPALAVAIGAIILVRAACTTVYFVDGISWSRDALATRRTEAWFRAHPRPVSRLVWSQTYMCILAGRDPWEEPQWVHRWTLRGYTWDRDSNVALIRSSPPGTLVFWDGDTGPRFFGLTAADFQANGYTLLHAAHYVLRAHFPHPLNYPEPGVRTVDQYLLYKERSGAPAPLGR